MSLSKLFPCFQFRLEDNIIKLDYSNNILSEGFPQVWQYEKTLEELNVTSTRINCLPPQLFYCQSLKVLLANNNSLESIPEAVGSLRQLQQLNLSRNFISNVPDNIKSCKNLTHLDISCNNLQKLPEAITCLISLQELILNETYLEFLPANFGRLVNLRTVELRSNNLISLPKSMQRLTNLQRLDIGCNEFSTMPEVVGELKQLRELWFDYNQIQNLPVQIGKLRELVHCEANGNSLSYLPNEIGNWRNLEVFSVSINNLTALPFSFGMLKSLVTLKCESNELSELPNSISNLENLEELVLSHNKLVRLPNTIGMLRKLRYLFADDNNLQKLPDEICSCSLLSVLSVSKNKISALPNNIGHLANLKVLNIVQNNIATLPVTVLSLVNLSSLWISNNQSQPLIPLQYSDISTKTELTCFMLPQLGTKPSAAHINNSFNKEVSKEIKIEQISEEPTLSNVSKRRICFAEETTILDTDSQIPCLSPSTSMPKNCNNAGNIVLLSIADNNGSSFTTSSYDCFEISDNSTLVPVLNSKDSLMRSPTPYPKELRLMAKYVQANNGKFLNNCNKESDVIFDDHASSTLPQRKSKHIPTDGKCWSYDKTVNQTLDNDQHNIKIRSNCNQLNSHSHLQERQSRNDFFAQTKTEPAINSEQFFIADNSPKPPPYHIARCFTKKSVEDLTKYEFLRKRQEQHNNFQVSKINIDDNPSCPQTDADFKNFEPPNKSVPKFDYQNNLMIPQFEEEGQSKESKSEETLTKGSEHNLESSDLPQTNNTFTNKKSNKSRTKWLFGVHRNPRVMQVNISWENGRDFEIDILPNREGIYVVSTISESNASQLIHPFDKLLEVDGVDFTNISINEARQVLDNSRPSISIMLSRK